MCQVCTPISALASSGRWPKPLESSIADLNFLVTCIHSEQEHINRNDEKDTSNDDKGICNSCDALFSLLRDLHAMLTSLDHERAAWWKSKAPMIRQLKEEVSTTSERKLTELHKINNACTERIEGMEAKLGLYVRWSLGLKGGIEELLKGGEQGNGH